MVQIYIILPELIATDLAHALSQTNVLNSKTNPSTQDEALATMRQVGDEIFFVDSHDSGKGR